MASVPIGVCPKCSTKRRGHALRIPRYQTCPKCKTGLEIMCDGKYIGSGFSPFTASELNTKPINNASKLEEDTRT